MSNVEHSVFKLKKVQELEKIKHEDSFSINALNNERQNALYSCSFDKFLWLIQNNINVHHIDNFSRNALFYASSLKKFNLLKEKNIDMLLIDYRNEHFLFEFIQGENKRKATNSITLIRNNIDTLRPILNHRNYENLNILHLFCYKSEIKNSELTYLCKQGLEYHHIDNNGYNILVHCLDNPLAFKFFLDYDKENKIPFPVDYDHNLLILLNINFYDRPEKYREHIELLYNAKKSDFYNMYYELLTFKEKDLKIAQNICTELVSLKEKEELQVSLQKNSGSLHIKRI